MANKDFRFEWQDWKKQDCACRIRIFDGVEEYAGKTIVIATDINEGNSVTNEGENIATLVCRQENIDHKDLVFVEHYGKGKGMAETYDLVTFDWNASKKEFHNINWIPWTKVKAERAVGMKLEEFSRVEKV